jgi:hypothetical protein
VGSGAARTDPTHVCDLRFRHVRLAPDDLDRYVIAAWLMRCWWVVAVLWVALSVWLSTSIGR